MEFLKSYLIAFVIFLLVDIIWLSVVASKFYKKHLGYLMKEKPNYIAALVFYLVYIAGLVYLVILPAIQSGVITDAILGGLVFGFVAYATYDLTNLATIKEWPMLVTVVDLAWGSSLSIIISLGTYLIYNLFT